MDKLARKITGWIKEGRGYGHGSEYQPWIKIVRGIPLRESHLNLKYLPLLQRHGHFMSSHEWMIALYLMWILGIALKDLREQYPLWPFPHSHPLRDLLEFELKRLPISRGTLEIAKDLGIKHGNFIGSRMPYVYTSDLNLTVGIDSTRCIGVAIKNVEFLQSDGIERDLEILAIQKAYFEELGSRWLLITDPNLNETLMKNLESCFPHAENYFVWNNPSQFDDFCYELENSLRAGTPVNQARNAAYQKARLNSIEPHESLLHAMWHRKIGIDLRQPLVMTQPAVMTDFEWVDALSCKILGGSHE